MRHDELETVFTTTHPAQAELVRVALENEGISAFVDGASQAGFAGALAVHVSVAHKDADRASALLEELEHTKVPDEEWNEPLGEEATEGGID